MDYYERARLYQVRSAWFIYSRHDRGSCIGPQFVRHLRRTNNRTWHCVASVLRHTTLFRAGYGETNRRNLRSSPVLWISYMPSFRLRVLQKAIEQKNPRRTTFKLAKHGYSKLRKGAWIRVFRRPCLKLSSMRYSVIKSITGLRPHLTLE